MAADSIHKTSSVVCLQQQQQQLRAASHDNAGDAVSSQSAQSAPPAGDVITPLRALTSPQLS